MSCLDCNQPFPNDSCTKKRIRISGKIYPRISYGHELRFLAVDPMWHEDLVDSKRSCHDCGIKVDGIHHAGCDMEECPKCHGQLIACGCSRLRPKSLLE